MINVDAKLRTLGPALGYPHTTAVRGAFWAAGAPASWRPEPVASVVPPGRGTGSWSPSGHKRR